MRRDCFGAIRIVALGLGLMLAAGVSAQPNCAHDRDALLALPEPDFDQDLSNGGGGWRALAMRPGCEAIAADLLRDYRKRHGVQGGILAWHEGQVRAEANQYAQAIALFESARKQRNEPDPIGWNHYVDASIAFLKGDRNALRAARKRLSEVPYDAAGGMPPLRDGYVEFPAEGKRPVMRMRWPPNIEVVDALLRCFRKPYKVAYGDATCKPSAETPAKTPAFRSVH